MKIKIELLRDSPTRLNEIAAFARMCGFNRVGEIENAIGRGEPEKAWALILGYSDWFFNRGMDIAKEANQHTRIGTRLHDGCKIESRTEFKNGLKDGLHTVWDCLGMKRFECNYKQGQMHGMMRLWHPNGVKEMQCNYENTATPHGKYESWYPNGCRFSEGVYRHGVLFSETKIWNANGIPLAGHPDMFTKGIHQ